jgi:hypothetical protein
MNSNIKTEKEINDNKCINVDTNNDTNDDTNNDTNNDTITAIVMENSPVIIEKKKRGRKKIVKLDIAQPDIENLANDNISSAPVVEKKIRKRIYKK